LASITLDMGSWLFLLSPILPSSLSSLRSLSSRRQPLPLLSLLYRVQLGLRHSHSFWCWPSGVGIVKMPDCSLPALSGWAFRSETDVAASEPCLCPGPWSLDGGPGWSCSWLVVDAGVPLAARVDHRPCIAPHSQSFLGLFDDGTLSAFRLHFAVSDDATRSLWRSWLRSSDRSEQ
jgi:hypothetical protein